MSTSKADKDLGKAVESGRLRDLLKALEAGANPNATFRTVDGELTALMIAAMVDFKEGATVLIEKGAKIKAKTKGRDTALHVAAIHGAYNVAEVLLEHGADVDGLNKEKETPLLCACGATLKGPAKGMRAVTVAIVLLNAGAAIDACDSSGQTPLYIAVGHGRADLCEYLIAQGADVNKADKQGETPLMLATRGDMRECRSLLLKAGARGDLKDKRGRSAMDVLEKPGLEKEEYEESEWIDAAVPEFKKNAAFERVTAELEADLKIEYVMLPNRPNTALFKMPEERARKMARSVESTPGILQLWTRRGFLVLPSEDKYDALACFQTNGTNYGLGPGNIIEGLRKIEATDPFWIFGVDGDLVDAEFLELVKNPKTTAEALYELCPDIVDQGIGSVGKLAGHLKKRKDFFLWWD
jgi:hypothetical protein